MDEDDIFARPPRRSVPLPPHQTCAVCGLRSDAIVCAMCIEHTASSIVWLEKLPALSMKEHQALDMLRRSQPLTRDDMVQQLTRYQARRAAATMPGGSRPYGWWKRHQTHLSIPEMSHADIVGDAERMAKRMGDELD